MAGFNKPDLARAMLVSLSVASSVPAAAEVKPDSESAAQAAPGVLFRLQLREYLEFRIGSLVTIRSNAGQVVITASDYRAGGDTDASSQDPKAGDGRRIARPAVWRTGSARTPSIVPERDRIGGTNICLYVEGSSPTCGDLKEIAGQVIYTASNP